MAAATTSIGFGRAQTLQPPTASVGFGRAQSLAVPNTSSGTRSARGSRSSTRPRPSTASNCDPKDDKRAFITVGVRVRPRLAREKDGTDVVEVDPDGCSLVLTDGTNRKHYTVDRVFDSRVGSGQGLQERLFDEFARPLVNESLNGYNINIFAYGHTGSGKTYTMLGDGTTHNPDISGDEAGLLPRFVSEIFNLHAKDSSVKNWGYTCEYYEVYNEQVKDLLAPDKTDRPPKVHVHPKHGVRVENLTTSVVSSAEETLGLVNFGNQMRTVAATTMNERSSRSHAIFTFRFEPLDVAATTPRTGGGEITTTAGASTIMLTDLAGREDKYASQNKAIQFREMCFINTSLFHLAHLITKLSDGTVDKNSWTDFRNSKLTLLLSPALVGNSRTALIATLTPLQTYFEDTVSTMNFAQSVKKIKTRPAVNNKSHKAMISELEAEVKRLNEELGKSTSSKEEKEAELTTALAMIDHYKVTWEDTKAQSDKTKSRRRTVIQEKGLLDLMDLRSTSLPMLPNGDVYPFFTKLADDPSLQGCCNYFLSKDIMRIGSDDIECDIKLHGVGITETMCDVTCDEDGRVEVEVLEDFGGQIPRVIVRGTALQPDPAPSTEMRHGDCIVLGYAHAFRLVVVSKEDVARAAESFQGVNAKDLARATVKDLDMASALAEVTEMSGGDKTVLPYITNLSMSARMPENELEFLQQAIREVKTLVDEANVITREVCGPGAVHFELRALTGIFDNEDPDLVVCVLQRMQSLGNSIARRGPARVKSYTDGDVPDLESSKSVWHSWNPAAQSMGLSEHMKVGGDMALLYVWPLEKFLRRLGEIRDIYQEGSEAGDNFSGVRQRLVKKPYLNPWREVYEQRLEEVTVQEQRLSLTAPRRFSVPIDFTPGHRGTLTRNDNGVVSSWDSSYSSRSNSRANVAGDGDAVKSSVVFNLPGSDAPSPEHKRQDQSVHERTPTRRASTSSLHETPKNRRASTSGVLEMAGEAPRKRSDLSPLPGVTPRASPTAYELKQDSEPTPTVESTQSKDPRYSFHLLKTKWDAPSASTDDLLAGASATASASNDEASTEAAQVLSHQSVPSFSGDANEGFLDSEPTPPPSSGPQNSGSPPESEPTLPSSCFPQMESDPLARAALWLEKTEQRDSLHQERKQSTSEAPTLTALPLHEVKEPPALPIVPLHEVASASRRRRTDSRTSHRISDASGHTVSSSVMGGDESPRLAQSLEDMWGKIDGFCQELRQRDEQVTQLTDERDRISGLLSTLLNRFEPSRNQSVPTSFSDHDHLASIAEGLQVLIDRVDRLEHSPRNVTVCVSPRSGSYRPGPPRSGHSSPRAFGGASSPRTFVAPPSRGFAWPVGGPSREARGDGTGSPMSPLLAVPVVTLAAASPSSRPRTPATPSAPSSLYQALGRQRSPQVLARPQSASSGGQAPSWLRATSSIGSPNAPSTAGSSAVSVTVPSNGGSLTALPGGPASTSLSPPPPAAVPAPGRRLGPPRGANSPNRPVQNLGGRATVGHPGHAASNAASVHVLPSGAPVAVPLFAAQASPATLGSEPLPAGARSSRERMGPSRLK